MDVVITGASGYLGQHLTAELISRGARVRALVRPGAAAPDLDLLKELGATVFTGQIGAQAQSGTDLEQSTPLTQAFAGADCGVHLIGSVAPPKGGPDIEELHRAYSRYFAQACLRGGVKKALLVTALGADDKSVSRYLATKRLAELAFIECLQEAYITAIVVRPSLIIGKLVGHRDSKLVERYRTILKTRQVVPLVGGGHNMLEPVFVGDLARAIAKLLEQDAALDGEKISQKLSMRQFVEALAKSMAVSKPMIDLPYSVAALAAGLLGKIQDVPLLSSDQVKLAKEDMVCQVNALPRLLAPALPTTCAAALDSYQVKAAK